MSTIGIHKAGYYTPSKYLELSDLEFHDSQRLNIPIEKLQGKYTKGLGQKRLSVAEDNEDAVSLAHNAVDQLFSALSDDIIKRISHVFVGTESSVDASKSIKTFLMDHLISLGVSPSVEGSDCVNACYGGTAAFLACHDALAYRQMTGRTSYGLVIMTDISFYNEPAAQPTCGAGAVAMILGPKAPILILRDATHSVTQNKFDFFKPELFPVVDGKLSLDCYLDAVRATIHEQMCTYEIYHTPFSKMADKAHKTRFELLGGFVGDFSDDFDSRVEPSLKLTQHTGNSYCAAVWANLIYLLSQHLHRRSTVGVFSYGSGYIASHLVLKVNADESDIFAGSFDDIFENRERITPEYFLNRIQTYSSHGNIPSTNGSGWRLVEIKSSGERVYSKL